MLKKSMIMLVALCLLSSCAWFNEQAKETGKAIAKTVVKEAITAQIEKQNKHRYDVWSKATVEDFAKEDTNKDKKITLDDYDANDNGSLEASETLASSANALQQIAIQFAANKLSAEEAQKLGYQVGGGSILIILLTLLFGWLSKKGDNKDGDK